MLYLGLESICTICKQAAMLLCHTCAGMTFCSGCHQKIDGYANHNKMELAVELESESVNNRYCKGCFY